VAATLDRGGKKLIVISTPQSGWFRCAGERGPGVAYFIGLARWAASRDSDTSFLFVSTSGHELGEIGMKAFVEERAPAPRHVLAWIHLGAGMATYTWEPAPNGAPGMRRTNQVDSNRYLMCSSELVPMLEPIYSDLPGLQPRKAVALGEFEILIKKGYKTIGFAAGHQFHHTPADSPEVTSPEILEPVGQALIRTIESIEETTKD
ncbi:MAG TPA: hypothetical protein VEZ90_03115, partial [Blastocatellia bacterium]|nr:hypothetical protein [Blastocatellia bacterium]